MASITASAKDFFTACETGKGWEACKAYCTPAATFAGQSEPLAGVKSLAEYCDWMKGLLTILQNGSYEVKSFATDTERNNVSAYAVLRGPILAPAAHVSRPANRQHRITSMSCNSTVTRSAT